MAIQYEHDSERSGPAASLLFSFSKDGVTAMKRICLLLVWLLVMGLLGGPALAQTTKESDAEQAKESAKSTDATKPVVAVFRLSGSLTETPTDDSFPFSTE